MGAYNVNNRFWQFLNRLADVFLLTLLWALLCVPVVTIGAATTACIKVVMELCNDAEGSIFKEFWAEFRRCFKRATLLWLLHVAAGTLAYLSLRASWALFHDYGSYVGAFFFPVIAILSLLLLMTALYTWPLTAYADGSLMDILELSVKTMIGQIVLSLSMVAILIAVAFLFLYFPAYCILFPMLIFYLNAKVFSRAFDRDTRLRPYLDEKRIHWSLVSFESASTEEDEPGRDLRDFERLEGL